MNKDSNTLKITTGAMFIAIFAVILLLNRQTGYFLEEMIFYILPIPMVAYAAKYGWKTSIPVWIAMGLISLIFGTVTTIFYAVTEAFIGMVLGACIYKKADMTKTMFAVMFMSVIVNVLNTIVLASLFGYNLTEEINELQTMMSQAFEKAGIAQAASAMLTPSFLLRIMVISMILLGALQGFLIFQISLLILNRLKFNVPRPKSVFSYYPPKWVSGIALVLFLGYYLGYGFLADSQLGTILQTVGMCGYFYLILFGFIGLILYVRVRWTRAPFVGALIAIVAFFVLPMAEMVVGVIYTLAGYHERWLAEAQAQEEEINRMRETGNRGNARVNYRNMAQYSDPGEMSGPERDPSGDEKEMIMVGGEESLQGEGSLAKRSAKGNTPAKRSIAAFAHMTARDGEEADE